MTHTDKEHIVSVEKCRAAIINASKGKMKRKREKYVMKHLDEYSVDLSARFQRLDFLTPYTV